MASQKRMKLSYAIKNVLILATQNGFKSISIPAVSTGIFGFPKDKCAKILLEESIRFVNNNPASIRELELIEFCIYDDETLEQFKLKFDSIKTKDKN
jgi:O-acetyl-ADP-ribose deacetylase (regulator of RNase III)